MAELLRQSMSDYRSLRSIPPFTMKSLMNHEFPTNYIVEGANQVMEVMPKLTAQDDMERMPPDPEDGELPEPVRPPSGPASIPFTPSTPCYRHQAGGGTRVVKMDTRGDTH